MARTVGGRVEINLNGRPYHPVADVEFEGSRVEVETVVNQDGTGGRAVKPKPYKLKITYRDMAGLSIDDLMASSFDFSMREVDTGRLIMLTDAHHEGTPSRNTTNGEISGLSVCGFQIQIV